MDTVSHAFWAFFAYRKKEWKWESVAFSIFPDVPRIAGIAYFLALGMGYHAALLASLETPATLFSIAFHSLPIVALFALLWFAVKRAWPLGALAGWTFHIGVDVATHGGDPQPILWPLSNIAFDSPVSYYRLEFHGVEFFFLNVSLIVLAIAWMAWEKKRGKT